MSSIGQSSARRYTSACLSALRRRVSLRLLRSSRSVHIRLVQTNTAAALPAYPVTSNATARTYAKSTTSRPQRDHVSDLLRLRLGQRRAVRAARLRGEPQPLPTRPLALDGAAALLGARGHAVPIHEHCHSASTTRRPRSVSWYSFASPGTASTSPRSLSRRKTS